MAVPDDLYCVADNGGRSCDPPGFVCVSDRRKAWAIAYRRAGWGYHVFLWHGDTLLKEWNRPASPTRTGPRPRLRDLVNRAREAT